MISEQRESQAATGKWFNSVRYGVSRETGLIDFDEVRVPFPKSLRPEVEDLTKQRWVPVLVHGEEVIHDSKRIVEYLRGL